MVTVENKVWYLRRSRLFERAGDEVLRDCLHLFTVRTRPARTQLFDQGAAAGLVYFLKRGRVQLSRLLENGKHITIAVLGPGDVFGEEGLFGPEERKTVATTVEESLVCTSRSEDLFALMTRQPVLSLNMARYLHEQRDEAISTLEDMAYLNVAERLLKLMQRLAHEHGVDESAGVRIDLRLTHADIASLIGSTRETVSLELSRLAKAGRIAVHDRSFVVPHATARLA